MNLKRSGDATPDPNKTMGLNTLSMKKDEQMEGGTPTDPPAWQSIGYMNGLTCGGLIYMGITAYIAYEAY